MCILLTLTQFYQLRSYKNGKIFSTNENKLLVLYIYAITKDFTIWQQKLCNYLLSHIMNIEINMFNGRYHYPNFD